MTRSFRPDNNRVTMALLFLLALVLPAAAQAQTSQPATPTDFQLLIFASGADPATSTTPIRTQTTTIGPSQNCGLTTLNPAPTAPVVNPQLFGLDDPFTTGRFCRLSFPTNLPAGTYTWAGVFGAQCVSTSGTVTCTGPRTVGTPGFSIVDLKTPPAAPTGLRLSQ